MFNIIDQIARSHLTASIIGDYVFDPPQDYPRYRLCAGSQNHKGPPSQDHELAPGLPDSRPANCLPVAQHHLYAHHRRCQRSKQRSECLRGEEALAGYCLLPNTDSVYLPTAGQVRKKQKHLREVQLIWPKQLLAELASNALATYRFPARSGSAPFAELLHPLL